MDLNLYRLSECSWPRQVYPLEAESFFWLAPEEEIRSKTPEGFDTLLLVLKMEGDMWEVQAVSRRWKQPQAKTQQTLVLQPLGAASCWQSEWTGKWILPQNLQIKAQPDDTLILALLDPKQRAHLNQAGLLIYGNCEIINVFCFKPLNLWSFVMWQ